MHMQLRTYNSNTPNLIVRPEESLIHMGCWIVNRCGEQLFWWQINHISNWLAICLTGSASVKHLSLMFILTMFMTTVGSAYVYVLVHSCNRRHNRITVKHIFKENFYHYKQSSQCSTSSPRACMHARICPGLRLICIVVILFFLLATTLTTELISLQSYGTDCKSAKPATVKSELLLLGTYYIDTNAHSLEC